MNPLRVLVVDDNPGLLKSVRRTLAAEGHAVDCVNNAEEAIPMVEAGNYHVVLADYRMPGRDGLWLLRNARVPRATKVVLITGHATRELINEGFALGVAGYLVKPFEREDLLRNVAFHAGDSLGERLSVRQAQEPR